MSRAENIASSMRMRRSRFGRSNNHAVLGVTLGFAMIMACQSTTHSLNDPPAAGSGGAAGALSADGGSSGVDASSGGTSNGGVPTNSAGADGTDTAGAGPGAGAGGQGPFACEGLKATCSGIDNFPAGNVRFGASGFTGGIAIFGNGMDGIARDMSAAPALRISGTVKTYSDGFMVWFTSCSNLTAFTGVSFTASTDAVGGVDVELHVDVNSDYPWQSGDGVGACTGRDISTIWDDCIAPTATVHVGNTPTRISIPWTNVVDGYPTQWNPATGPAEILGLHWQFPWSLGRPPYTVDLTIKDITFDGQPELVACPAASE